MRPPLILLTLFCLAACAASTQGHWVYDVHYDKLYRTDQPNAFVLSDETYQLKFPYTGGTKGIVQIALIASDYKLAVGLSRGNIDCKNQCDVQFRFDNDPVQTAAFKYEEAGNKTLVVPVNGKPLFDRLASSKVLIMQLPIASNGSREFTFDTAALDLGRLGPATNAPDNPQ